MLSRAVIEEALAEIRSNMTPEKIAARNQRLAQERAEAEEQFIKWGGPPLGLLIQREREAKESAAKEKVETLKRRLEPPGVPFGVLVGTIQCGAWRSPLELAKAYAKGPSWVRRLRSVAISQGYMSAAEWRSAFAHRQGK